MDCRDTRGHDVTLTDNQKRALVKRIADIYEKVGVAGLALGLFQYNFQGALIGLGFLAVSLLWGSWRSASYSHTFWSDEHGLMDASSHLWRNRCGIRPVPTSRSSPKASSLTADANNQALVPKGAGAFSCSPLRAQLQAASSAFIPRMLRPHARHVSGRRLEPEF